MVQPIVAENVYRWRALGREPQMPVSPKVYYVGLDINNLSFVFKRTEDARDMARQLNAWADAVDKANLPGGKVVKVETQFNRFRQ